ncbi:MAG: transglycosylase domain-containing protein [Pseudomonadota bacterium]|uniref:transglycosylase domain-containing protein n=1 Tax=Phenylobacterium sp. TaxID=1871053 RepID=UPI0025F7975B|nr:transglycosylase domain-containing protein [Phenylobacterium sp.]MBT9471094.1 transglycosylase domain-containing protein [Phenylobacterium sp.]
MTDPTGAPETVRAPMGAAIAKPPFWRRRLWQVAGGAVLALIALIVFMVWSLPLGRALEPLANPTLILVSADGKPFARRGSYKEQPVDVTKLPKHVPGAFVAIEDRRFYSHIGLDFRAIARALQRNVGEGEVQQGGSTITQQLAKNAFLSNQRSLRRKAQEALIALYLEARLTKDEILSRYLSTVYFGDGVFGLRAAARHYFDKTPETLSIGEAAMLAGMVKAPSRLAPTEDLPAARERARVVLATMVEVGAITPQQARANRTIRVREGREKLPVGTYFADWVSPQARRAFESAYGEVLVPTTLDSVLQERAETIVSQALKRHGGYLHATQAALVAMRPDGRVLVMVGGDNYKTSQFNRVSDAQRQPGSAFKLFVYQAALRSGMTPDSLILDAPVTIGDWSPKNHEGHYANREIHLRNAFAGSSNVAAVRLAQQVGRAQIVRAAQDMGVRADFPPDLTLALGTAPMTLLDLTSAYAGVAAGQAPVTPYGVPQVRVAPARQLPRAERDGLLDLLRAAVTFGTGNTANVSPYAYGKTGTTQDYRDALFVGFVGDMVIGVWVGNDDNSPMNGVAGAGLPAEIWRDFARYAMSKGVVRVNGKRIGMAPVAPPPVAVEAVDPLAAPPVDGAVPPVDGAPTPAGTPAAPAQPAEAAQPAAPAAAQPPF